MNYSSLCFLHRIEPANCYFCLLAANEGIETNQYVVCFITECDRGLDSFRNQLDQHALKIESIIKDTVSDLNLTGECKLIVRL